MYDVKLTQENGRCDRATFETYEEVIRWIAAAPDAGIMIWEDGDDIGTERFIQLQHDVEAARA